LCDILGLGLFSFTFESAAEKNRILSLGPWSFSSNLLILKQCDLDTPDHSYVFTHCDFWVHILGLPRDRITIQSIIDIAATIGRVQEVKMESKGFGQANVGKARVHLDLSKPLRFGTIVNLENKKIWVDFKFERLSHTGAYVQ